MAPHHGTSVNDDSDEQVPDISFGPLVSCPTPPLPDLTSSASASDTPPNGTNRAADLQSAHLGMDALVLHAALAFQAAKTRLLGTTFALDLAKRSHINARYLVTGQVFDPVSRPPIFVTGALQLPGTLNAALGHWDRSPLKLTKCMTSGTVTFCGNAQDMDHMAQYGQNETRISGMVVLGRGRDNRRMLEEWHGDRFLRVSVQAEIRTDDLVLTKLKAFTWVERKLLVGNVDSDDTSDEESEDSDESIQAMSARVGGRQRVASYHGDDFLGDGLPAEMVIL